MEQPPEVSFATEDGIFIKQMYCKDAFTVVPQHSHEYNHVSMLAVGSVRVWSNGKVIGDFKAPCPITIKARTKHTFLTLEPGTTIYCIHNISRTGEVDIHEEHVLGEGSCPGVTLQAP